MASKQRPKPLFQLTPEQLALQAARRELKAQKQTQTAVSAPGQPHILRREWATVQNTVNESEETVTIMTWNLLAQALVRRELFPGSDALKFSTRAPMVSDEILMYDADILCLQEVDKLDTLLPALEARYSHIYASGRGKEHGCMILFKKDMYEEVSRHTVYYDEEDIRQGGIPDDPASVRWRKGLSRATKNIGLLATLRRKDIPNHGVIVATTHLFWHPAYTYERAKQVGILLRAVSRYQKDQSLEHYSCFIAGDFNLTPEDATYSLIVGETVTNEQEKAFNDSRVVHVSADPTIRKNSELKPYQELTQKEEADDEGQDEEKDPDRIITNSRACEEADGLLTFEELVSFYRSSGMIPLRSIYDESSPLINGAPIETIGQRLPQLNGRKGSHEPSYTSYTHYWKSTLDYIFLVNPNRPAGARAILRPHRVEDMSPCLPKQGVCGSDHVSLAARVVFGRQ